MSLTISLKKAHAFQLELEAIYNSIILSNRIDINEFEEPKDVLSKAYATLKDKLVRKIKLIETRYQLRKLIDDANYKNAINKKLTDIARLSKEIGVMEELVKSAPERFDTPVVIKQKLLKMSTTEHYNDGTVRSSIITGDNVENFALDVSKWKKQRTDLVDSVAAVNITCTITIDDDIVDVLKQEKLIFE